MGQIQRLKNKIIARFTVDEIIFHRVAVSKDVMFTMAEMIRKFAEMKAVQKAVKFPAEPFSTSFDPAT